MYADVDVDVNVDTAINLYFNLPGFCGSRKARVHGGFGIGICRFGVLRRSAWGC